MRGLRHRLTRLENPHNQSGACPVCSSGGYRPIVIHTVGDDDESLNNACARCGRSLVLRLTFDDREMETISP